MKILLIRTSPTFLDVEKHCYQIQELGLAAALTRKGHTADLLFWTNWEEKTVVVPVENGASIHLFYRRGASFLKNGWFFGLDALAQQYDILQTAEYNQWFSWHLAGKYREKTVVYHGPYASSFNKNYLRMCRVFDVFLVGRYRKNGTRFLAKSPLAAEFLRGKGIPAQQITVVGVGMAPEGLSGAAGAFGISDSPTTLEQQMRMQSSGWKLLYIGRMEPRRDILFLLDVLLALRGMGQKACLYLLGDGAPAYRAKIQTSIRKKGLTDCVFWQREAEQSQLAALYRQADFFLLASKYEIFGMVLLEAMYFGCVVLTTYGGGAQQLIQNGKNGLVLEKDAPTRWAQALCTLAHDPARKARIETAARETIASAYTWDALVGRFLQVYGKMGGKTKNDPL